MLFNHHKIKKKWGRRFRGVSHLGSLDAGPSLSLHDCAWHKTKANPLWNQTEQNWKRRLYVWTSFVCFLAIIIILLFHPLFTIKHLQISGEQRLSKIELNNSVEAAIHYHKLFIFSASNYFLLDLNDIKNVLKDKFSLQKVVINKVFPDSLNIQIQENTSRLIYDNGKQYSFLNDSGVVTEILQQVGDDEWVASDTINFVSTNTSTIQSSTSTIQSNHKPRYKDIFSNYGLYPIVYDARLKDVKLNSPMLKKETVAEIISWFENISQKTNITFAYLILQDELGTASIKTGEGWELKVSLVDIDTQFKTLQYLLKEKVNRLTLKYIDLRFKDRTFWQ